jgi:phospholipid/cholesterol/gamma-HCH transport system substrate-binding protein
MSSSNSTLIKAGVFVFVSFILLIIGIFLLASDTSLFESHYDIYTEVDDVQGLSHGSVVTLAGLRVGNITDIQFRRSTNKLRITLSLKERYKNKVTIGSVAEVKTAGALGDKFIYITPNFESKEPIQNGGEIEFNNEGGIFSVISKRGKDFELAFDVLLEAKLLLESINKEKKLESLISNLDESSAEAKNALQKSGDILNEVENKLASSKIEDSLERLNNILKKLDEGEGTLGALINDPSLHSQLKQFLGGEPRKDHIKSLMRKAIKQGGQ